jgi:hypothetical protein
VIIASTARLATQLARREEDSLLRRRTVCVRLPPRSLPVPPADRVLHEAAAVSYPHEAAVRPDTVRLNGLGAGAHRSHDGRIVKDRRDALAARLADNRQTCAAIVAQRDGQRRRARRV